jgi:hypothetical protein
VGPVRSARDSIFSARCAELVIDAHRHSIYAENLLNQYQYSTFTALFGSTPLCMMKRAVRPVTPMSMLVHRRGVDCSGEEKLGLSETGASQALFDFVAHDLNRWCLPKVTPQTWRSAFRIPAR